MGWDGMGWELIERGLDEAVWKAGPVWSVGCVAALSVVIWGGGIECRDMGWIQGVVRTRMRWSGMAAFLR